MTSEEISPAGVKVIRYEPGARELSARAGDYGHDIVRHLESTIGPVAGVIHEVLPDRVAIDILIVAPTAEHPCWTFVTLGASAYPMATPDGLDDPRAWRRAEYMISLPPDWAPLDANGLPATDTPATWYPLGWLKRIARAPSTLGAWFSAEHTIPNGDPPKPLSEHTRMSGFMVFWPISAPDAARVEAADGELINPFALIGLDAQELALARDAGASVLIERLEAAGLDDVFAPHRPSVV